MRIVVALCSALALSGCITPLEPAKAPKRAATPVAASPTGTANFARVVARMEPVAEAICKQRAPRLNCDYKIVVDPRANQPANAYQTLDKSGRPIIGFTRAMIATAQNDDELAFVLGHEAAHHIAGHLSKTQDSAISGALIGGILATLAGGGTAAVDTAQNLGATAGARRFSKDFELQADRLGTRIAYRAGYDPIRGAQFFARIPDPGDRFLGTHPPNADRVKVVRTTMNSLR